MNKQLLLVMFGVFIVFVGFGIVIPVIPEILHQGGMATVHLGFLLSIFSIASFFMSPVWGALSDKHGRRPVLLAGLAGFTVSFLVFAVAEGDIRMMYLSRLIGGLFSGAVISCAIAYLSDITSEEKRTKTMGLVGMSIGLGFIFGPAIGGIVSAWSLYLPFWLAAMLSFLVLVGMALFLPESLPMQKRGKSSRGLSWSAITTEFSGGQKYLYILSFLCTCLLASLEATFQFFVMQRLHATPSEIGVMFAVCGVVGAAVQGGIIRKYVSKGDEPKTILWGFLLSALGFLLLLNPLNMVAATVFLSIFGAGNALIRPCVTSLVTQHTRMGQGVASGINSSMDSLGRIIGPLVGSVAFGFHSSLPFWLGAALSILAVYILFLFQRMQLASN
jgi:DHA1 family multidrug resistance protein-like MFS transporter